MLANTRSFLVPSLLFATLAPAQSGEMVVAGFSSSSVGRYDATTGRFLGRYASAPLIGGHGAVCGPDGNVYIASFSNARVLRYRPDGTSLGTFVAPGNGLDRPAGLCFGPDRNLYVASLGSSSVLRYDGTDGRFLGVFVTRGSGGLDSAEGLAFGPDSHLYVCSAHSDRVLRYDGQTGAFIDVFAGPGNNLVDPHDLDFDAQGNLYVASFARNIVNCYGRDGRFLRTVVQPVHGLAGVHGVRIGPNGNLFVSALVSSRVVEFDIATGNRVRDFAGAGNGVSGHANMLWLPVLQLPFYAPVPGGAGSVSTWEVQKAVPGELILFLLGTRTGILPIPHCASQNGATANMLDPQIMLFLTADAAGSASFTIPVPPALAGVTILFQAIELARCRASGLVRHRF